MGTKRHGPGNAGNEDLDITDLDWANRPAWSLGTQEVECSVQPWPSVTLTHNPEFMQSKDNC